MAPLRSFEVSRRIAVSIDLDRTAARAWTKSFAPYFGVVAAVTPSLCMCLKGYCSLVELLNSLLGALRSGLSLSNTVERARSAAISPNSLWKKLSVDTKLSLVGQGQADSGSLERCYVPFASAKVVLFLGLFSPFHFHRFLNLCGMCELHLRTFAVAGDHGWKIFFLGVSSAFRQQVQRLGPRCTSDRLHRELVRELARRPLFFCQFVLVTLIQHSLDSSRSRRGAAWRRGQDMEDGGRGTRGSSWSACTYSRGVEGFFNDVTLTKCIGGAPTLPDYTSQSSSLSTSSEDCCFGKRVKIDTSDFVRRGPGLQAAIDVTPVTAWEHSETLLFRPETRDVTISRRVESLWRSKLFAM